METRMVALDISSNKTGVSLWKNGKLTDYKLLDCSKNKNTESRMKEMAMAILNVLKEYKPHIVVVEDDWSKVNVQTTKMLSKLIGVAFGYAMDNECQFEEFLPSQWRNLLSMDQSKKKRQELKQMAIDYVKNNLGISASEDKCDAICVGLATIEYFNQFD